MSKRFPTRRSATGNSANDGAAAFGCGVPNADAQRRRHETCFVETGVFPVRPLAHVIGVLLVLPGAALAAAFLILGHAIASGSLTGFFGALLAVALWLIPWGFLATAVALVALLAAGFSPRYRWFGALCVAALAIGSSIVVSTRGAESSGFSAGQLLFFLPALLAAVIGLWLAVSERPRRGMPPLRP